MEFSILSTLDCPDILGPWKSCRDTKFPDIFIVKYISGLKLGQWQSHDLFKFVLAPMKKLRFDWSCFRQLATSTLVDVNGMFTVNSGPSKTCLDTKNPDIWRLDNH